MKRNIIPAILFVLPLFSLAGETDSSSVNMSINEKKFSVAKEVPAIVEEEEEENAVLLSYDIVSFEENQIPVTKELFDYHVSTGEFSVSMDYNSHVKRQIDYFGTRWQVCLKEMLTKSQYFFPYYEEVLSEFDMPLEIKYLSIIESGLNPHAYSRVGAAGAWQFMPATGRIFDLDITYKIDERRDIEKSTRAACQYLKQMYGMYHDWHMALAAYNCGPGNVRKAMRLSGKKDFWGIYNYLPRETQNYVPKFIAMTYMMSFYDQYCIIPSPYDAPHYEYTKVYCTSNLEFAAIAEMLWMTKEELKMYNPEMRKETIPFENGGYYLKVPVDKDEMFYIMYDEIATASEAIKEERRIAEAKKPKVVYHYVRKGECLPIIARKYGCSVSQLKKWNGIRGSIIYPKQKLKIYRA